ncbi:expressed unknown protein [Seminavis robusta]|uniref:Uncharacterized protein n=1 Tax=Seminavis robusta TaxID=568900 RepID=A0A9N8D857_9STRA|nr:expressed unknown protein [Seminavis robusta]|eukprot:Sro33_g021200.1 n/a (447) ;mRNA; r:9080-10494
MVAVSKLVNRMSSRKATKADHDTPNRDRSRDEKASKEGKRRSSSKTFKSRRSSTSTTFSSGTGTPNERIIEKYAARVNAHKCSAKDLVKFYTSKDVLIKYDDLAPMTAMALQTEIVNLTKSFKDFKFSYGYIREVKPGLVLMEDLYVAGTHNGEPYKFEQFPAIAATGKRVELEERVWFTMEAPLQEERLKSKKERKSKKDRLGNTSKVSVGARTRTDTSIPVEVTETSIPVNENEQNIQDFIAKVNEHASVEELLQFYANDEVPICRNEMAPFTAMAKNSDIVILCKSFTNFKFSYDSVKEIKPGVVLVDELVVSGTHNGKPYTFGGFPPIQSTDKHVVLDPERVIFTMKNGKIIKEVVKTTSGNLTGAAQFYVAIGGRLETPCILDSQETSTIISSSLEESSTVRRLAAGQRNMEVLASQWLQNVAWLLPATMSCLLFIMALYQ